MEINWDLIKNEIISETREIISIDRNINISQVIDLFIKVIEYPVEEEDLAGISTRIPNALQKIFIVPLQRIDKNAYFPEIVKIEQYLRKVLFLINKPEYDRIAAGKEGLSAVIGALQLNPNKVDYNNTRLSTTESIHFTDHLVRVYNLRNLEAHNCTDWNNAKLYDELRSVLVIYIFSTYRHFKKLKSQILPHDFTQYLNGEIQKVKIWQNQFVHIEGKEEYSEVELYAHEVIDQSDEGFENNNKDVGSWLPREGTIDSLRKSLPEKQMIVLGEVGMGKSTTLQFLHFKDAKEALTGNTQTIPVYFELKNLTIKDDLLQKTIEKIGIEREAAEDLLVAGVFNFYLDGLNEIERTVKTTAFTQINIFLTKYPENFFLITSRPQHYNREFDSILNERKIPVFILQAMGDQQINEFLSKNGREVKEKIVLEIQSNFRLKNIIKTPLMLKMLIAVVHREGKIPSEKGKIIRSFIQSLYEREQRQIIDFDKDLFHLLLCCLGYHTRDLTGSNSGLDRDEFILPILEQRKKELGENMQLLDFLKKAVDLHILVKENKQYSFSHEL